MEIVCAPRRPRHVGMTTYDGVVEDIIKALVESKVVGKWLDNSNPKNYSSDNMKIGIDLAMLGDVEDMLTALYAIGLKLRQEDVSEAILNVLGDKSRAALVSKFCGRHGKDQKILAWQWAYGVRVMMGHGVLKYDQYEVVVKTLEDKARAGTNHL